MNHKTIFNNLDDIDVVILCGGFGTRLRSVVNDRPKVLAKIGNRTFIDILIDNIKIYGFKNIILCVGYLKDQIKNHFNNNYKDYNIRFSDENTPLGTGGALKNAMSLINSDPFMVMNGDSICKTNYQDFYNFHINKNAILSMVLTKSKMHQDFGNVILDQSQRIIKYQEKENINYIKDEMGNKDKYLINAGIYLMRKDIFSYMPNNDQFSLEYDFFPKLIDKNNSGDTINSINNKCFGFITECELIDIGTPERYKRMIIC